MSPPEPERVLAGRYHLEAVLGHGGMGDVYAGHDLRLGRPVAIKLLRSDIAVNPGSRRRFEREAQMAARVTDPHIVAIYDVGEDDVPFIVMERLPGRTLADELLEGPVDVRRLHLLAAEILSALSAAHAHGVLHRDIKPGNVLLTADGHVKVADFGIAKSADDASDTTTMFATAGYVAPERLTGHPATAQSDLFSLGVVLYQAATGKKPFTADSPLGIVHAIAYEQAPPLAATRPDLDANFVRAVEQSLHKEPDQRFASAAGMAAALGNFEIVAFVDGDETVRVPHDDDATAVMPPIVRPAATRSASPPTTRQTSRRTRIALVSALLVLMGAVFATWAANRDTESPSSPTTTRPVSVTSTVPTATVPVIAPTVPPTQAPPGKGNEHGNGNGNDNGKGKGKG